MHKNNYSAGVLVTPPLLQTPCGKQRHSAQRRHTRRTTASFALSTCPRQRLAAAAGAAGLWGVAGLSPSVSVGLPASKTGEPVCSSHAPHAHTQAAWWASRLAGGLAGWQAVV